MFNQFYSKVAQQYANGDPALVNAPYGISTTGLGFNIQNNDLIGLANNLAYTPYSLGGYAGYGFGYNGLGGLYGGLGWPMQAYGYTPGSSTSTQGASFQGGTLPGATANVYYSGNPATDAAKYQYYGSLEY